MRKVFKCNPLTIDGNVKPRSVSGTPILVKRVHYFSVRRLNESDAFKVHRSHEKLVPTKIMEVIIMKFTVMMEKTNGIWFSEEFTMSTVAMQYAEEMANNDDIVTIQVITPDDVITVKDAEEMATVVKKQVQATKTPVADNKQIPSARDKQIRMTKRLMQKIAAYCKSNKEKGFGTTVSSYMLVAYIAEIQFGMPKLKGHEKELTSEQLSAMTETRNWLIKNGYLKQATIKDEKGFVFYNENYDGNRKGVLYDISKFRTTGKTQTTSYLVTNKIAKWLA